MSQWIWVFIVVTTTITFFPLLVSETNWQALSGTPVLVLVLSLLLIATTIFLINYCVPSTQGELVPENPDDMSLVDILDEREVPRDKLILVDHGLGQGSFGTVVRGVVKDFVPGFPNVACAVKTVPQDMDLSRKGAALMGKLDCHHVVKLLGVISKTQPLYVIMELMTKGDLKNYLQSSRPGAQSSGNKPPSLMQMLRMAAEIADGMAYIHKNELIHQDLAARNCLVGEDLVVKIGDFGVTKEIIEDDGFRRRRTRGFLPVRWMAPELFHDGVFTNQRSDVWAYGVVLWEIATLALHPYQGLSNIEVLRYVQSGRILERPGSCPDILFDLMTLCWRFDHRQRPSFVEILDRLTPNLDPSFSQVSFYHSSEGLNYRAQVGL